MSASGTRELLETPSGVVTVCRTYLSVEITEEVAAKFVLPRREESSNAWMNNESAVSAAPVTWLKNRIMEAGLIRYEAPDEPGDKAIVFIRRGHKVTCDIAPVARSKIFRTEQFVFPIDLTAMRVAGPDVAKRRVMA